MALAGGAGGRITAGAGANLIGIHAADRNPDATCYVGNIDMQATEELIWELFVQAGPVGKLYFNKKYTKTNYYPIPGAAVTAAIKILFPTFTTPNK
jgi:hypothetical protein